MSTASDPITTATNTTDSPQDTTAELVGAMLSFVDVFTRWSRSRAASAGPSLPRLRLLNTLHCEGPQKMADLADTLRVTPRSVTALVDALEGEGLVRRLAHPSDRRITMIELTENAPDAAELFAAHQASVADLCSLMTPDEQRQYLELTRRMEERLRSVQTLAS